jgi:hypothetical protein
MELAFVRNSQISEASSNSFREIIAESVQKLLDLELANQTSCAGKRMARSWQAGHDDGHDKC